MPLPDLPTQVLGISAFTKDLESSGNLDPEGAPDMTSPPKERYTEAENILRKMVETAGPTDRDHVTLKDDGQDLGHSNQSHQGNDNQQDLTDLQNKTQLLSLSSGSASTRGDQANTGVELKAPTLHEQTRDGDYMDPTPKTPRQEVSPSRAQHDAAAEGQGDESTTSELQSILDQFDDGDAAGEEIDHKDSHRGGSRLKMPLQHPPRLSSLEPLTSTGPDPGQEPADSQRFAEKHFEPATLEHEIPSINEMDKSPPVRTSSLLQSAHVIANNTKSSPSPSSSRILPKLPPPGPDPEPDLPFDFHRFLEQLRHRTADPVAKFLRSFLIEFGKKQWMVHEQEKIIHDFLTFISNKMAQCEVWRGVSEAEFDNAKEGMEKLVMNRLYSQTFSPAIPAPAPLQGPKAKRKNAEKSLTPGRKGQHQEDIERDEILGQKVRIYGWVQEEHLDIPLVGDNGRRFLILAQQELLKIKTYRAPRDKIICVLNCCKVIFGLLRNSEAGDTSADSFVPLLIYVVLHANPEHLVSNVQYILRFRNQEKLGGEAGYYLSSLMGAIQFIESLDRTSLTISDKEFEKKVEEAVCVFAERHKDEMAPPQPPRHTTHPQISEKSTLSQPEVVPRNSLEVEYSTPRRPTSAKGNGSFVGGDGSDDSTAVGGLLRTIQRPLSSLGRMFSEDTPSLQQRPQPGPPSQPDPPARLSPAVFQPPPNNNEARRFTEESGSGNMVSQGHERKVNAEDAAARQASAEAEEAQRIQRAEHCDVVETLAGMFPDLDKDLIDDVVRQKQGRVGLAVDACLALNT